MNEPRYSCGPFSRVFFMFTRDGLRTFTYRRHAMESSGTQLHTIVALYDGGPRFNDVFVETCHVLAPVARSMPS